MHAVEADLYAARLQLRQGHLADAAATLERAFAGGAASIRGCCRRCCSRGLELATEVAGATTPPAERLWTRAGAAVRRAPAERRAATAARADRLGLDWPRLCTEALAPMEPDVPFDAELLTRRVRCYEATNDARLAAAHHDLAHFASQSPMQLATGLPPAK